MLQEKYRDVYDFNLLPGGMWTGDNVKKMSTSLCDYIKDHNVEVKKEFYSEDIRHEAFKCFDMAICSTIKIDGLK